MEYIISGSGVVIVVVLYMAYRVDRLEKELFELKAHLHMLEKRFFGD